MKIGTWLLGMAQPLIAKILLSLGFSVVSIAGLDVIINQIRSSFNTSLNTLPVDMLNVFLLAGGGQALGIVMGAISTKLMLWQITSSTKLLGSNPQ